MKMTTTKKMALHEAENLDYYGEPTWIKNENGFLIGFDITLTDVDDEGNFYFFTEYVEAKSAKH